MMKLVPPTKTKFLVLSKFVFTLQIALFFTLW